MRFIFIYTSVALKACVDVGFLVVKPTVVELPLHDNQYVALSLLVHPSPAVRSRALSMLCRSLSLTSTLPTDVLVGLKGLICYFHTEVDPRFRNEFIVLAKRLILGILTVTSSSTKYVPVDRSLGIESTGSNNVESSSREAINHQNFDFLKFYMYFLAKELQPTASYQRHIIALQVLATSLKTSESLLALGPFDQDARSPRQHSYTGTVIRSLVDLMMDPFDDVRGFASAVLLIILNSASSSTQIETLERKSTHRSVPLSINALQQAGIFDLSKPLARARMMLRTTSRADHADGVARLYDLRWQSCKQEDSWHVSRTLIIEELLTGLEEDVRITASDLHWAVGTRPLHGHLISLRSGLVFQHDLSNVLC